jgi:SWI/SNF-related matrix-associated actin-dependent regulator 1 of chromatin subfamily A
MPSVTLVRDDAKRRWVARCSFEDRAVPKEAGFRWDPASKCWWTNKEDVAAKLADPGAAEALMAAAAARFQVRQESIEASRAEDADIEIPCPEGLAYLPYQRAGIAFAMRHNSVLFGDEMGLGKTIQVIGLLNADTTLRRTLVVCPASLKLNWRNELRRWRTRKLDLIVGTSTDCPVDWQGEHGLVLIINYDIAAKHRAALIAGGWDMIVCDEAHYLKNPDAKRTQAIIGADAKKGKDAIEGIPARRRVLLTGTPIPNRPIEGQPLFHFLAPEEKAFQFFPYARKFCSAQRNGYGWDFSGSSNLQELQDTLRATIMIRRLKADVLTELPAKRRAVIEISANGASSLVKNELRAWEEKEERMLALRAAVELSKASDKPEDYANAVAALKEAASAAFAEMSRLRHETALATCPYIIEHVQGLVEQGEKIIVFAHHRDVIEKLAGAFGSSAVLVYGGMPIEERQRNVERFQSDPNCMVFVGGILAAGVGLTLTASAHVVFAELDWVPGNVTQAEDRAHRIGQKEMVIVEHFVLEGSLSARMATVLIEKQEVIDQALDKIMAAEPVLPTAKKERAATENATQDAIAKLAEQMTPARIAAVHEGLKMLAGMDSDHARELNGAGFSKIDVYLGHSLADRFELTPRQAALGSKLVNKYRRQLPTEITEGAKA